MSVSGLKYVFTRQTDELWVAWFDPSQISNHLARFAMTNRIQHDAPPGFVIICDQIDQGMVRVARNPCIAITDEHDANRVQQLSNWLHDYLFTAYQASLAHDQHHQPDP